MTQAHSSSSASVEWDGYAEEWIGQSQQRLWRLHSDALNARLLRRWLPKEKVGLIVKTDLFDEAVTGGLYPQLLNRADCVAALDVSPRVVRAAYKQHGSMLVMAADVRDVPIRDESADVVVSLSTLDHFNEVDDIPQALREVYRILKPGGTLVLTMDNPSNPWLAVRNSLPFSLTHRVGLVPYPVGRTHDARAMTRLTEEAGFDIIERTSIMHAPRLLAIQALRLADAEARDSKHRIARTLMAFERLEKLPSRVFTGPFVGF
jgi:SAM-dependent methyltransferase